MSQASTSSKLMNLPADIHKLIISALDAPVPLFTPSYVTLGERSSSFGDLKRKHAEYYGKRHEDDQISAQALVNWSATCQFYRELLAPTIFQNVVLRTRAKSMSSVQLLFASARCKHIRSLSVVGTYAYEQWPEDMDFEKMELIEPLETLDHDGLFNLLANLPPNLDCLTLDFPTEWMRESDDYLSVFNEDEQAEQTLELEAEDVWRKLIRTVLATTANNDISTKGNFELRLLNTPPLPCSVYWTDEFHQFLNHVTNLTLSFDHFDNGAGWNMNTMSMPVEFSSKLGEWFWDHLSRVKTLKILADGSWPIGLAPGRCDIPLALPSSGDGACFPKLEELELKWWLVDQELITLVSKHMPMLNRLSMSNYFANSGENSMSVADWTPTWAEFFDTLCKHPTLKTLALYPHHSGVRLLDPFKRQPEPVTEENAEETFREAWNAVEDLQREKMERIEAGDWNPREDARMQRIWPHCSLDDKYGMVFDSDYYNAVRFGEGHDHAAWLRLCDALEARGGGCTIVEETKGWNDHSEEPIDA